MLTRSMVEVVMNYELTIDEIMDAAYYGAVGDESLADLAARVKGFIEAREERDPDRFAAEVAYCYIARELDSTHY